MNYKKIYKNLINKSISKKRNKSNNIYYENHHIIPRCMGGEDSYENLILLTAREHFIAHVLLIKIYPKNHKLLHALNYMMNNNGYDRIKNLPKSKLYEIFRKKYSQYLKDTRMVIDFNGDMYRVDKNDIRLKTGELKYLMTLKKDTSERIRVNDGTQDKNIKKEYIDVYMEKGWKLGTHRPLYFFKNMMAKNHKRINKDGEEKSIHRKELKKYINLGWKLGSLHCSTKNTFWINNGCENKMILESEFKKYKDIGWKRGVYRKSYKNFKAINNGTEEKRIDDEDELKKLLENGWKFGRLCKTNKGSIWIIKSGNVKMIKREEFDTYEKNGWIKGFKSSYPPK